MPTTVTYDNPPAGISMSAALKDENVLVSTKGYLSSEAGNDFITHLEGIWGFFSGSLQPKGVLPSQVDHLLAVLKPKEALVYCNELQQRIQMRSKRAIKAGEPVSKDDIAGIEELVFIDSEGTPIEVQPDEGVVLIMSVGWRKCLFYDLEVFGPEPKPRSLDLAKLFGRYHQHLLFQEMYSIRDDQWERMFEWGWFPFIWMTTDERKKVIHFSDRASEPKELFEEICKRFKTIVDSRINSWNTKGAFQSHKAFIDTAVKHYEIGDYLSAIQVLFPRIEGVMREIHLIKQPGQKAGQKSMVEALVSEQSDYSLLLPNRFRDYLLNFYFRAFNQSVGDVPLSRNSVAHGASLPEDYDFVKASLGFMILDQMFYYQLP